MSRGLLNFYSCAGNVTTLRELIVIFALPAAGN